MGQSGDPSAQPQQPPDVPREDKQPMIEHDQPSATADEPSVTDEAGEADEAIVDETAPEDATTLIVPQAQLTPPPVTPAQAQNGAPHPMDTPALSVPPQHANQAQPPQPQQARQAWQAQQAHWQGSPRVVPVVSQMRGQHPPIPGQAVHAPWHTASSWGATTFVITAETAAGFSYLFWWVSGLLVYFNERENRYVRFHAVQSILLTGALSVFSVIAFTIAAVLNDVFVSTQQHVWQTLCIGVIALSLLIVLLPWLAAMIAAWTGTYLQLPIIGDYAERFAAPPIQLRP